MQQHPRTSPVTCSPHTPPQRTLAVGGSLALALGARCLLGRHKVLKVLGNGQLGGVAAAEQKKPECRHEHTAATSRASCREWRGLSSLHAVQQQHPCLNFLFLRLKVAAHSKVLMSAGGMGGAQHKRANCVSPLRQTCRETLLQPHPVTTTTGCPAAQPAAQLPSQLFDSMFHSLVG